MTADLLLNLESKFPHIRWREPLPVSWAATGRKAFACRVCTALDGLGEKSPHQWDTLKEAEQHLREKHLPKD